jgi:hypothetical protein
VCVVCVGGCICDTVVKYITIPTPSYSSMWLCVCVCSYIDDNRGGINENAGFPGRHTAVAGGHLPLSRFTRASEESPGTLRRLWLAPSPSGLGFTRPLGSSNPEPLGVSRRTPCRSSPALTLRRSGLPRSPSPRRGNQAVPIPVSRLLASLRDPSAYPSGRTLLFIRQPPDVWKAVPCSPKVPPAGFGYPLGGVSSPALGGLFQPPTLMGFALQSFLPTRWPALGFPRTLRSCAFASNPSA